MVGNNLVISDCLDVLDLSFVWRQGHQVRYELWFVASREYEPTDDQFPVRHAGLPSSIPVDALFHVQLIAKLVQDICALGGPRNRNYGSLDLQKDL